MASASRRNDEKVAVETERHAAKTSPSKVRVRKSQAGELRSLLDADHFPPDCRSCSYGHPVVFRSIYELPEPFPEGAIYSAESVWLCGANKVLVDVFLFYSTWLVVGLTVKRLLVIGCPMRSSFKCTVKTAKRIVYVIGLTSFSIALLKLRYSGYEQDSTFGFKPCKFTASNSDNKVVYVYIALSTWLPCLLIFIGNALLIRQVQLTNKTRYELSADKGAVKRFNETHRMLGLLITVSVTTLVLMFPLGIVETFELYWDFVLIKRPSPQSHENQQYIKWQQEKLLLKWVRGLFFSVYQWAFSTNFFLYCLTGRKFRTAAADYFRNCARNPCWKSKFVSGPITRFRNQVNRLTRSSQTTEIEMESQNNNRGKIDSPETRNDDDAAKNS